MKRLFRLLALSLFGGIASDISAQLAPDPIFIEMIPHYEAPYVENVGAPCNNVTIDLEGYVTYKVYLCLQDPTDCIQAIFGADSTGVPASECTPDGWDMFFDTNCGVFQHPLAGPWVTDNSCLFQGFFPSMEWDSFMTLNVDCSTTGTEMTYLPLPCEVPYLTTFEGDDGDCDFFDGGDFYMDSNAWFNVSGYQAGPDLKVLIAQITTCGDLAMSFGVQILNNCTPGQPLVYNPDAIFFNQPNPCNNFPTTNFLLDGADCFGDINALTFEEGGYGFTNYQLHDSNTDAIVNSYDEVEGDLVLNDLTPGSYYISTIDSIGCRDTSDVFVINPIPELLELQSNVLNQILCANDNDGQIELICSGGTEPYTLQYSLNGGALQNTTCGTTLTNLLCGSYEFFLTDNNDCTASSSATLNCPVALELELSSTDIVCYGQGDGTVTGSVTGGTGNLTVTWTPQGNLPTYTPAPGPINLNATGIGEGDYTLLVTDANGCTIGDDITITEPDPFTADTSVTNVTCFDGTDGCIEVDIVGGTSPYNIGGIDMGTGLPVANICALPAGMYAILVLDANNCPIPIDSIIITEPEEILYAIADSSVSCFGLSDGGIYVSGITGGTGAFSYSISPSAGIEEEGADFVNYTNLPANTYTVTITDDAGCVKTITGITIDTPSQLSINLEPEDVSCFGANDGTVVVSGSGGTGAIVLLPDNTPLPVTIGDLPPGTYTYTIQDESGCTDEASIIINEPELLEGILISTQDVGCGGDCNGLAVIQAVGGSEPYNWQILQPAVDPDSGTLDPNPYELDGLCADPEYIVAIVDINGCSDTLTFEINEPEPLVIDYLLNPPTCTGMTDGVMEVYVSGGQGTLTTVFEPEDLEVIEIDSVTYTIAGIGEGPISITLFDESDCSVVEEIDVVPAIVTDMILTTFSSPETCWNEQDGTATVAVQNGFQPITYQWDDPDQQITPTAVGLSPNIQYTVVVTDSLGCTLTTSVFVDPTIGCFFIANALTPNGDGVNDYWVVGGLEYFPNSKVMVFNRWGQTLYESTGYSSPWEGTFKGEKLPAADYYFAIEYDSSKDPILGTVTIKY